MVLVPLEPCEKTGDSVLIGSNGTTFGNKSDFKVPPSPAPPPAQLLSSDHCRSLSPFTLTA